MDDFVTTPVQNGQRMFASPVPTNIENANTLFARELISDPRPSRKIGSLDLFVLLHLLVALGRYRLTARQEGSPHTEGPVTHDGMVDTGQ